MALHTYTALAASTLLLFFGIYLLQRYAHIPGPKVAKVTDLWYIYKIWKGDFEKTNIALHKEHGEIVQVGPSSFSFDDPDAVKIIYGTASQFIKSDWYSAWSDPTTRPVNLFAQQDIAHHRRLKRRLANVYSMSSLVTYETRVDACISELCKRLDECQQKKSIIDLQFWLQIYALDVIGEITFSKPFGLLEAGQDKYDLIQSLEGFATQCTFGGFAPWIIPLAIRFPIKGGQAKIIEFVIDQTQRRQAQYMEARQKDDKHAISSDFLTKIIEQEDGKPDDDLSEKLVMGASSGNVFAGSDTTAIALTSIFTNLLTHPAVRKKLLAELDAAIAQHQVSEPITFAESQKLPYFQAVIHESLRIHPSVGLPLWRMVPSPGMHISGRFFAAGTHVGVNPWVAHHNTAVYGADAAQFRPERWIDSDEATLSRMNHYFMAFGAGSRTCIGKNISLLEIGKVVPEMLRRYEFSLVNDGSQAMGSLNRWFVKQHGLDVGISARKGSTSDEEKAEI